MFALFLVLVLFPVAIGMIAVIVKGALTAKGGSYTDNFGDIHWVNKKGELHREDGPAVETLCGDKRWYQNGNRHRTDGPAIERSNGSKDWYINGLLHRSDGPAVEHANGNKSWYVNGKLHRLDGPAIEYPNGMKEHWIDGKFLTEEQFLARTQPSSASESTMTEYSDGSKYWHNSSGQLHRTDGPAVIDNGSKHWFQNCIRHRTDGPAIERADGTKEWWIDGVKLTEEEFLARIILDRAQPELAMKGTV